MTQLNLFEHPEPEKEKPFSDYLPPHFKTIGGGNYDDFLQLHRTYSNSYTSISQSEVVDRKYVNRKWINIYRIYISRYELSDLNSIDDIPIVKRLLYTLNSDTKEWEHKAVNNYRINSLLHNIYDSLNERSNHV